MRTIQKIAFYFGLVNLVIGLAGFVAPLVTKNDDKMINTKPGLLFNVFAINWLHALLHVLAGAAGLLLHVRENASRTYLWISSALFGALSAVGIAVFGFKRGIFMVMGMALNAPDNVLHAAFAAASLVGGMWKPRLYPEALLEEFKETAEKAQPVHTTEHEAWQPEYSPIDFD